MSQINFKTVLDGRNIEVVGGWDRPLGGYHFTIYDLDADEEDPIYCNMEDPKLQENMGFPQTNSYFQALCHNMKLELPTHFWDACRMQAGNLQLNWNPLTEQYEGW